ncbi:MAG TPA: hypothetical protein DCQ06_01655 [Myxococcales bacterium]|nr:hypothetical protein [Myxococcales bacterium]HAN30279.1 hypothetical protein [Myxococcales bacterium]|tara:strand:+ start:468 stop:881 length:414 start_codon:yes stop_codon:yes gene_type:complete
MLRQISAFFAGFLSYFVVTGVYYGVIMLDAQKELMAAHPESFLAEPRMEFVLLTNLLWIGMIHYLIVQAGSKSAMDGAKKGAIAMLLINGGFNLLILAGFSFVPMDFALLDIAVNVPFGAIAGAAIAAVLNRGEKAA